VNARDDCPHRPPCPGCPRFGASALPEAAWASLAQLSSDAGLPPPRVHRAPGRGHRHRARLAVRGRARSPKIGLFQAGSHRIVDTPNCAVHHPLINEAARALRRAIRETGVAPYADEPHRGALRYVQLVVERATQTVQVVLVGNGASPDVLGALPAALEAALGDRLQGLFFNAQPERSNAILGPETLHLSGQAKVREHLGGVEVLFPPDAFGQNHLPLFERAIERVHALIPESVRVAEAYCGVGAIGLGLLGRAQAVRFNERSPAGLAGLRAGIEALPPAHRARSSVHPGAAGDRLEVLEGADVAIVDPPRKGLDTPFLDAILTAPPRRLVYLACGLPSLLREVSALTSEGGLRLRGVEVFDFFPFTEHVETLVWLDRDEEPFPPPTPEKGADRT